MIKSSMRKSCYALCFILLGWATGALALSGDAYAPQRVQINHDFSMRVPRDWVRRANVPAEGLAALFAPNMDISTPNVSIFILKHHDVDPQEVTKDLIQKTPGATLNHVFKRTFGDSEAVISDISSSTQQVKREMHILWNRQLIKKHTQRSFHCVVNDGGTLLIISCTAATDAHIRDCRLIMASIKRGSSLEKQGVDTQSHQ